MKKESSDGISFSELRNNEKDINEVIDVWYTTSVTCHDFIDKDFWHARKEDMRKKYIPSAETILAKYKGKIVGFISLVDNRLAAIFVLPDYQGRGIGRQLLMNAFEKRDNLLLTVYEKNTAARHFYHSYNFKESGKATDEHTGETEITMEWNAE